MIGGVIFLITTALAQAQYSPCNPDGSCNTGYVCQSAGHSGNAGLCVPNDGRVYLRNATRPTSEASSFRDIITSAANAASAAADAAKNFFNPRPTVDTARYTPLPARPATRPATALTTAQNTGVQPCTPGASGPTTGGNNICIGPQFKCSNDSEVAACINSCRWISDGSLYGGRYEQPCYNNCRAKLKNCVLQNPDWEQCNDLT